MCIRAEMDALIRYVQARPGKDSVSGKPLASLLARGGRGARPLIEAAAWQEQNLALLEFNDSPLVLREALSRRVSGEDGWPCE